MGYLMVVTKTLRLLLLGAVLGSGQEFPRVSYSFLIDGQPFTGSIGVLVKRDGVEVARGRSEGTYLIFDRNVADGSALEVVVSAGVEEVLLVHPGKLNFNERGHWLIEVDYPPFSEICGEKLSRDDTEKAFRIVCSILDVGRGDPSVEFIIQSRR